MEYLKIFTDFAESIEPLSDAECGRLFRAMLKYASSGAAPEFSGNERFIWPTAKLHIDREAAFLHKQRTNGAKGGRPKKPTETQDNPAKPTETQKSHKDKDKEKDKEYISAPAEQNAHARHRYGQYDNVLLSDEDLAKLKTEFPRDWQQRIDRISEYVAKTGKGYKNYLAAIRSWARNDKPQPAKEPEKKHSWMKEYL